jgi:hypothetical protein
MAPKKIDAQSVANIPEWFNRYRFIQFLRKIMGATGAARRSGFPLRALPERLPSFGKCSRFNPSRGDCSAVAWRI